MIKLIASDLDGTLLLGGAQSLETRIFGQIERLKERGILFMPASGRQYDNLLRLFRPVWEKLAYICENGCISFYQDHKVHKEIMERRLGQEMLRAIWDEPTAEILLSGERTSYVQPKKEAYYLHLRDTVKNNVTLVKDIFHDVTEDYFKISVYKEEGMEEDIPKWQERFGNRATVVTSGFEWLDMMPLGVNKGLAMKKMQNYLGIAPDECMAFGDNYNDLEMLAEVKYNYVMENAPKEIKDITGFHTSRVEDVLEQLLSDGESSL